MKSFSNLFPQAKNTIGMIHILPLIGTPAYKDDIGAILEHALAEAEIYLSSGIDGLMIENMHDLPYLNRHVGPEIVAMMSILAHEIKKMAGETPCGIQILAGANEAALAVAKAAGFQFIRAEGFVFSHVADEGHMDACAGELLRYRKLIEAQDILIFTDIKKKHSAHSITGDVNIVETAQAAGFFKSDGLILTGNSTGKTANLTEIEAVKSAVDLPVLVGSGVTIDNVQEYLKHADALIIGSHFKHKGYWANPLEPERIKRFMAKVHQLR